MDGSLTQHAGSQFSGVLNVAAQVLPSIAMAFFLVYLKSQITTLESRVQLLERALVDQRNAMDALTKLVKASSSPVARRPKKLHAVVMKDFDDDDFSSDSSDDSDDDDEDDPVGGVIVDEDNDDDDELNAELNAIAGERDQD